MSDATDPTDAATTEDFLNIAPETMEELLATIVSRLEPISAKCLRAVRAHRALRCFAQALRSPIPGMADASFETTEIDEFWSHSWHGRKWNKALTAMYLKNGMLATAVATFVNVLLAVLVGAEILPPRFQEQPMYPYTSWWCSVTGSLLYCIVFIFWQPRQKVFVDVMCINQENEQEKCQAILSMGAFLKCSEKLLVLWDTTYCHRLWCVFELAGYLHSRGTTRKPNLEIRPTILGPCLVSLPIALSCVVVLLPFIPWAIFEESGMEFPVAYILWPTFGACAFVFFYFSVVTLRAYFRSVSEIETIVHQFSVKDTLCYCCSNDHIAPDGSAMACDRKIVFKCITTWFGSLSNFETRVREQVARCLDAQLTREVFTYRQCAASAMPVLWHFMDSASTIGHGADHYGESRRIFAVVREFVRGIGWSCGVLPTLFFVAVRLAERLQRRRGSRLGEILINCCILGAVCLIMLGALVFEIACWNLHLLDMEHSGPYELFPGTAVFSLSTVSLAVLLFSCRRCVGLPHQLQKPSEPENGHELVCRRTITAL
ncbi:unnamed protein product [Symbiodinium sp. CCMP2592]|nr:unnamed protein product [Symbiodinium sp. CCMP2592]